MNVNGFTPILAVFYSVFHPTEGSKVLSQVPEGAVIPLSEEEKKLDSSCLNEPLIPFYCIKNYVIPKPQLCNRLVSIKINEYRVIGYPIHIYGSEYERNSFIFNFSFIFSATGDSIVYEMSIRRLARMFMALEEQSHYLSKETERTVDNIHNIIEQIYQDLNNYSECQIPIDESNSVNMKLFPLIPPPSEVESFHVPITTVNLKSLLDENWDPTMEKIIPFINGINSIRRISDLADADYELTKQCIQHLMYYKCLIIVDIFQFSNIYAATNDISMFLTDPDMFNEFQAYVYRVRGGINNHNHLQSKLSTSRGSGLSVTPESAKSNSILSASTSSSSTIQSIERARVGSNNMQNSSFPNPQSRLSIIPCFNLYRSLTQGVTIYEWHLEHQKSLQDIDIRRFITFGVIKGLIYRVHSYPIYETRHRHHHGLGLQGLMQGMSIGPTVPLSATTTTTTSSAQSNNSHNQTSSFSSERRSSRHDSDLKRPFHASSLSLKKYDDSLTDAQVIEEMVTEIIKQPRHFDSICTDLRLTKQQVEVLLQKKGDWTVVSA